MNNILAILIVTFVWSATAYGQQIEKAIDRNKATDGKNVGQHQDKKTVKNKTTSSFNKQEQAIILTGKDDELLRVLQTTAEEDLKILKAPSLDIDYKDPLIEILAKRMFLTVRDEQHPGVGIAAPQIGINRNLIWVQRFDKPEKPFEFYINPKILWRSKLQRKGAEGCLSIPDRREEVLRSYAIRLQYTNREGILTEEDIEGFTAVIFQHETDHLLGILFPDRLTEQETLPYIPLRDKLDFSILPDQLLP